MGGLRVGGPSLPRTGGWAASLYVSSQALLGAHPHVAVGGWEGPLGLCPEPCCCVCREGLPSSFPSRRLCRVALKPHSPQCGERGRGVDRTNTERWRRPQPRGEEWGLSGSRAAVPGPCGPRPWGAGAGGGGEWAGSRGCEQGQSVQSAAPRETLACPVIKKWTEING